jgi:hypothetical protein
VFIASCLVFECAKVSTLYAVRWVGGLVSPFPGPRIVWGLKDLNGF